MIYTIPQLLVFFYIYCFLGWCFESAYVSLKKRKLVNRGFMKGPFLPLYGSGAMVVLLSTMPFKDNNLLVYVVGAIAATVLEFATGVCMEALFKVRYWDYSNQKFNFMGHICLGSSIAWGFLSLGLINFLHRPIDALVNMMSDNMTMMMAFALTIYAAADFALAFRTAMDIRNILSKISAVKDEVKLIQKRIEVMEAVALNDARVKKELRKESRAQKTEELIEDLMQRIEALKNIEYIGKTQQFFEEFVDIKSKFVVSKEKISGVLNKEMLKMLRRNPTAKSREYQDALDEMKDKKK